MAARQLASKRPDEGGTNNGHTHAHTHTQTHSCLAAHEIKKMYPMQLFNHTPRCGDGGIMPEKSQRKSQLHMRWSGGVNAAGYLGNESHYTRSCVVLWCIWSSAYSYRHPDAPKAKEGLAITISQTLSNGRATWSNLSELGFYPYGRTSGKC